MELIAATSFGAFAFLLFLVVKIQTVTKRLVREQQETREQIKRLEETLHAIHDRGVSPRWAARWFTEPDPEPAEPEYLMVPDPEPTRDNAMSDAELEELRQEFTGPGEPEVQPGFYRFQGPVTIGTLEFAGGTIIFLGGPEWNRDRERRVRWVDFIQESRDRVSISPDGMVQFSLAIDAGSIQFITSRSIDEIAPAIRNVQGGIAVAMNNFSQAMSQMGSAIGGDQRELAALQRERVARERSVRRDIAEWEATQTAETIEDLREAELLPPKPKTRFERILDDDGCIEDDQ